MSCEKTSQVQAFYDGELTGAARAQIEAHVRQCSECTELLADLKRVSGLINTAQMAPVPAQTIRRVQQTWWAHRAQRERGVLRLAEWMTGVAAAVLIGAMVLWPDGRDKNGTRAAGTMWQAAAVTPPASVQDDGLSDVVALAQWMADDLSDERGGER